MMRDYDVSLIAKIKERELVTQEYGFPLTLKRVPDDERDHVLDPRVLAIAEKKKNRITSLKKKAGISAERYRPDKICYDLTTTDIQVEEKLIKLSDHMIDIYIYSPEKVEEDVPVILFFHGGGFTAGDMKLYVNQMKYICELAHAVVIFPEYRLAPENPYPAAIDDCMGTIEWAVQHASDLHINPEKLMIVGDSAGGSLVNSCIIRDTKGLVKKAFDIYPGVDSATVEQNELYSWSYDLYPVVEEQKELAFSRIDKIAKACMKGSEADSLYLQGKTPYNNPEVSIVYATDRQLKNLPPMVIVSSEYDFLRVGDEYLMKRMYDLGCDVKCYRYCGCDHGFLDCLGLVPQAEELCDLIAQESKSL